MDKKESIEIIKKFVKKLGKDFSVQNIVFFGSRASGKPHKDSDIDIIIVSKDFQDMGFFKRVSTMYHYWDALVAVDFICYTPKEFEKLKKRISIVSQALKEGIIIKG